jgi:nicotinic acid mononucleotide adenylyltransferase
MRFYDTPLFIEIIESVQGVVFIRHDYVEHVHLRYYQGLRGKLVVIDTSYEDIEMTEAVNYLHQLGLENLVTALFPP